jgi:cytidylate kinase
VTTSSKPASFLVGFFVSPAQKGEAVMTVITISRQFGSYGDEIAQKLCGILGYQYFDKQLVMQAARESGLSDQEIVDYSEENYKVQTFLKRMLGEPPIVGQIRAWKEDVQGVRIFDSIALTEETALALVQKAIRHAHEVGNVVVVGRGGQAILQNEPDVLHVRIEAPLEIRIQRVKQWKPLESGLDLRRAAQDLIEQKDAISADYLQRFYNLRWDDPALYHLIINTEKLSIDQAAHLLAQAAREFVPEPVAVV